ncbi:TonB-dependent receptor [Novosphingobium terrae]|uniref:TonB-dependent receptor n=1 Tax=Novosphingobium terrae TaxID=2726189 RepID=UPI00197DC6C8|nr:TonB-dependent receptor [Novosphingobium terrae]
MTFTRSAALAAASMLALACAPTAFAQSAAPAADAGADAPGDIVVTAQHRKESNLTVPITLSVVNNEQMSDYASGGGDTLIKLSGRVPSLYSESTTGRIFPVFFIRGLGNIDFYLGASQPVSLIQDDVVEEHVVLKSNPIYDVGDIEVLKGPQGSLFGRNTTAGIIKIANAAPTPEWKAHATASWGTYNSVNVEAGVGGPLNADKTLMFRVSGLYQHRDNWISNNYQGASDDGTVPGKNVMGGFNERDGRLQLLWQPDADTSVKLEGHYRHYDGSATVFYRQSVTQGSTNPTPGLNLRAVNYAEGNNNPQAYDTHGEQLKIDHKFGGVTLTSISALEHVQGYSRGDTDGGAAAAYGATTPLCTASAANPYAGCGESMGRVAGLTQLTQEVRLAGPDNGKLKWQVGGIYFDSRDNTQFYQRAFFLQNNALGTAPNPNNWVQLHNINTSWGLFGQATYNLTPAWSVTGGVRVTNDTKSTALTTPPRTVTGASTFPTTAPTYVRMSDTQPSWDIATLYRLDDHTSFYARVARGFRGPTIQGRSAVFSSAFTTAKSETNTSYEAGLKSVLFNNHGHFNLTGFYYKVKNIQLNGQDSNGSGVLFNANQAQGYGAEAEFDVRVQNLTFNAGLSLLHTEVNDPNVYAQVGAVGGVPAVTLLNPKVTTAGGVFAQINGNPLPDAPSYNLNLGLRYDLPIGPGKAFVSTDWTVQGKISLTPYTTVEYTTNGTFEGGLRAGYEWKNYSASVFVRNLTNERNLIGVLDTNWYRAGAYNDPRIIGVTLSAKM